MYTVTIRPAVEATELSAVDDLVDADAIYNMFSWVRDQPDHDLDGLMEEIDGARTRDAWSLSIRRKPAGMWWGVKMGAKR